MQASDVTAVVATHGQVAVLQKAHAMLADHLELDSWAEIWAAADGRQAFDATTSRAAHAMTANIIGDLLPNFAYCEPTHRFTRMVSAVLQCCAALLVQILNAVFAVLCCGCLIKFECHVTCAMLRCLAKFESHFCCAMSLPG